MEGPHSQLCAGLSDALGGDDANGLTHLHYLASGGQHAVAGLAHAAAAFTVQRRPGWYFSDPGVNHSLADVHVDHLVALYHYLAGLGMSDRRGGQPPVDPLGQGFASLVFGTRNDPKAVEVPAVLFQDNHFLGDIDQPPGQVTAISGPECGIGQTFACSVSGDEVLQGGQALAETGLDGQVDDSPFRVAHQTAHPGHLFDLGDITFGARNGHHRDAAEVGQIFFHERGGAVGGLGPGLHGFLVALFL